MIKKIIGKHILLCIFLVAVMNSNMFLNGQLYKKGSVWEIDGLFNSTQIQNLFAQGRITILMGDRDDLSDEE